MRLTTVIALLLWIAPATASFAQAEREKSDGRVVAAAVTGDVEAVRGKSGAPVRLKTKDVITRKHTVNVGAASATTLVFSNGATINLQENSALAISEFLQDPFSVPFAMPVENEEPTVSKTKLNLLEGEVVCKVKKLRTDGGTTMTIDTPVGAAGIRGTTFAINYRPDSDGSGKGRYLLSVTEGVVSLTDADGNVTLITAGREIEITFRAEVDEATGKVTIVEILGREIRGIPLARLNRIKRVAARGEVIANTIVFDVNRDILLDFLRVGDGLDAVVNTPPSVTEANPPSNFETEE